MNEDSLNHYHFTNDVILGNEQWKGNRNTLNIVMIGLAQKLSEKREGHELHRLLETLLSETMPAEDKFKIFEEEYDIPMQNNLREDVSNVSNLGQGIEDRTKSVIIVNMHKKDYSIEQIAEIVELSEDEVERIIEENSPAYV
jgi:predicted transposase YdaD